MSESPPPQALPLRFPAPNGPPQTWNVTSLADHLKTAMAVELTTIPLYLCAIYSIIDGKELEPYKKILIISKQEMLHLTLAGNMLRAIGRNQALYDKDFIPTYPDQIFYDKVDIKLGPADKRTLESFVQVERPHQPRNWASRTVLERYRSIGHFYEHVKQGIEALCPEGSGPCALFRHNHDKQFGDTEIFKHSGPVTVKDRASGLAALEKIVVQGEGAHPDDPNSHYNIFQRFLKEHETWKCHDYLEDPKTAKYESTPFVHKLSLAFDALYCYLLQTIDRAWETSRDNATVARKHLVANIRKIMIAMTRVAELLVVQKLTSGKSPAPCFEFYPPGGSPLSPEDLFKGLKAEISEAAKLIGDAAIQNSALVEITTAIDACKPTES
jgi:hypothetical protein